MHKIQVNQKLLYRESDRWDVGLVFSLAWSFAELLEPPVSAAVYVNCGSLATVN